MAVKTKNLTEYKKHKKISRFLKRIILLIVLVVIIFAAYSTRSKWLPFFNGILNRYRSTIVNDGELASGNFPLSIETSSDNKIFDSDNIFGLLTDTHLALYEKNGKLISAKQHGMATPIVKKSPKRILVYDLGGTTLFVDSRQKNIFSKNLDNKILYAQISDKDYVAVVTKSDKYAALMTIYDKDGNEVFYSSSNEKIINIIFNSDSTGCIASTMSAEGGQIVSKLTYYKFNKDSVEWKSNSVPTLSLCTEVSSDGEPCVIGSTKYCVFSSSGQLKYSYDYPSDLVGFSSSGDVTALVQNNSQRRSTTLTVISKDKPVDIAVNNEYKNVHIKNGKAFIMTDKELIAYSSEGKMLATAQLSKEYSDFAVADDNIFLLGGSFVDRIDFKS